MATGGMEPQGTRGAQAELAAAGRPRIRRRRGSPLRLAARSRVARRIILRSARRARVGALRLTRRLLLYTVVAGLSAGAGVTVAALYGEYGYHPIRNAAEWAGQPLRYAAGAECADCHGTQVAAVAERPHAGTSCQACHGPLEGHAGSADLVLTSTSESGTASVPEGSEEAATLCLTCHAAADGRPAGFPVVTTADHFAASPCLLCHDPHATDALDPPRVLHELEGLPDCLVCHGPDGLRPTSERHPVWPEGDCLGCHLRRGTTTP